MVLKIRMRQQGRTNRQTFRLVVTDVRNPRDGKYLEMIGWYNPVAAEKDSAMVDLARVQFWLGQGAQISDNVQELLARVAPDFMKEIVASAHAKRVKSAAKRRALKKQA